LENSFRRNMKKCNQTENDLLTIDAEIFLARRIFHYNYSKIKIKIKTRRDPL
jgi:hypothetical protein